MIRDGAFSLILLVSAASAAADEGLAVPAEFDGQQDIETAQTAVTPTPSAQDQSDFTKGLVCPEGTTPPTGTAELSDEEFSDLTINWDRALRSNQTNQALAFAQQVIPESRARAAQSVEVARHAEYLLAYARVLLAVQRGPQAVQITCEAAFLFAQELGPRHQSTKNARVMHAQALAATNDLENAEPLFREHVASVEATAPAAHPELLNAKATLARVRAQRGFAQEALQTLREIEAKLPEETPWQNRAILVNAEATIVEQGNDPDAVEKFYEHRFAQHTGEGQNDLAAKEWLLIRRAGWFGLRGQPEKAVEVIDQRLALYSGIFDPKSPAVLSALHAKASLLRIIPGRGNEAMEIAKSNLAAWETKGSAAPATYAPRALVAELLIAARDYGAAIALFEENVELQKQSLPPGSPGILEAQRKQAIALQATGKFTSARQLFEAIVPQYAETLGPKNYLTIEARIELAKLYEETGRLEKAERLASAAFSDSITYLGHRNPATGAASLVLSGIYLRSGRSQEALILSQRLMDLWASDPDKTGDGYFYQLTSHASALFNAGRRAEGIELSGHAVALARKSFGVGVNLITGLTGHARTLSLAGRSVEAEPFAAEAFQLAQDSFGPNHFATRGALEVYVFVAQSSGQGEQALRLYDRYTSEIVDDVGVDNLEFYFVLLQYATLELSLGYVESAHNRYSLIEEATRDQDDLLYKVVRNMGLLFLALSASELGDQQRGLDAISQAEELTQELYENGMLPGNARTFPAVFKSKLLLDSQEFSGAEETLNNMLKAEDVFPSGIAEYDFLALGIHTAARLNLAGREAASVEPAIALAKLYRDTRAALGFDPRLLNGNQIQSTTMPSAMQTIANAAYEARDIPNLEVPPLDLAFEALQNATLDQSSLAIAKTASLRAAERANVGELAAERLQLIDQWRSVNQGLAQSLSQVRTEGGASGARSLRLQRTGIEARLAEIDQILESDFPEYYSFIRPTPLTPEAASSLMSPSEAALLWVPSEFGTHVMVVSADGLRWHRSDMTQEQVSAAVDALRGGLDQAPLADGSFAKAFNRKTAHKLYRELIAPVEDALEGKDHLFIAAGGALSSLPPAVLVTKAPEGDDADADALRSTAWLDESYALVQIPSLQSLQFLRQLAANDNEAASQPFLGFGNPELEGQFEPGQRMSRSGGGFDDVVGEVPGNAGGARLANVERLRALPKLTQTEPELSRMAVALMPGGQFKLADIEAAIFTSDKATESNVKDNEALSKARVIAFATHGLLAGEQGVAEPGLVFTPPKTQAEASVFDDGLLTASEITELSLAAQWVILSACNTAAGDTPGAPGLSGLARSFFYAGAESLLASHWPVLDKVAPLISVQTLRPTTKDTATGETVDVPKLTRAQAFARAVKKVRDDKDNPTYAHPAAWAPFVLIGDK